MNDDTLQDLWNQARRRDAPLPQDAIRGMLGASVRREWSSLRLNARVFLALLALALAFDGLSLLGPDRRAGLLAVRLAVALVLGLLILWNARFLGRLRALDEPAAELTTLVRRQLGFFHGPYERWLWSSALSVWLVSFAVTGWVEDRAGGFRIVDGVEYAAVTLVQVLLTYALLRFAHRPMIQRAVAALEDLERQVDDETRRVESERPLRRVLLLLVFVAVAATVAWGLFAWLSLSG